VGVFVALETGGGGGEEGSVVIVLGSVFGVWGRGGVGCGGLVEGGWGKDVWCGGWGKES